MPHYPLLLLIVVGAVVLFLIRYSIVYDRKKRQARMDLAASKGWTYTAGPSNRIQYSIAGQCEGGAWCVEVQRGTKNSRGYARFTCAGAALGGGVVYIGVAGLGKFLQTGFGKKVARWGAHLGSSLGAPAAVFDRLLESPVEVPVDDPDFSAVYSVLTTDASLAQRVLTTRTRDAMLCFPSTMARNSRRSRGLSLIWSAEGLQVGLTEDIQDPEIMATFAEMGIALVGELRGGW